MRFTYVCVPVVIVDQLPLGDDSVWPDRSGDHSARDSALWSLHQHGPLQAHARTESDVALTRRTRRA